MKFYNRYIKNQDNVQYKSLIQAQRRANKQVTQGKRKMIDKTIYDYVRFLRFDKNLTYKEIQDRLKDEYWIYRCIEQIRRYCQKEDGSFYNFTERKSYKKFDTTLIKSVEKKEKIFRIGGKTTKKQIYIINWKYTTDEFAKKYWYAKTTVVNQARKFFEKVKNIKV